MQPVDSLSGNVDCRIKSESHIRSPDIIVYGLWYADNVKTFLREHVSGLHGSVAADAYQAVETELLIMLFYKHGLCILVLLFAVTLEGFLPRSSKDRSAKRQDT